MTLISKTILDPPVIKTTSIKITSFSVSVNSLELFKSAKLYVLFYSDDGSTVDSKIMILTGNDYAMWKEDDQYIIDYVIKTMES